MTITQTPHSLTPDSLTPDPLPSPPSAPAGRERRAPKIVATVLVAVGLVTLLAGAALGSVSTRRDGAGFFHTDSGRIRSEGFAITSDPDDMNAVGTVPHAVDSAITFRIRATSTEASKPLFVGVGRTADVDAYLAQVHHDVVTSLDDHPLTVQYRTVDGASTPTAPDAQAFWLASTSGTGSQELRWHPGNNDWTAVVMNADGTSSVVAVADFGVGLGWLVPIAVVLAALGVVFVAAGVVVWRVSASR